MIKSDFITYYKDIIFFNILFLMESSPLYTFGKAGTWRYIDLALQ